jgi:hypothetical protein
MGRTLSERAREKLAGEIAGFQTLDVQQLRMRWRALYGTEAPVRFSRDLLIQAAAYRLQERTLGGLKPATRRLFQRVAASASARLPVKIAPMYRLEPGAVLIREWGEIKHQVTVLEHGFSYGGKHYRSLSELARLITGSRWSGPLFFGLRQRVQSEASDGAH